jgi:hypothetical protein
VPEIQNYNEKFGETIKILPSFENHVPPDLQHLVLQTITLTIIIVTTIATVALFNMQSREAKIKNFFQSNQFFLSKNQADFYQKLS